MEGIPQHLIDPSLTTSITTTSSSTAANRHHRPHHQDQPHIQIDPTLFAIEQAVNQVRRGKISHLSNESIPTVPGSVPTTNVTTSHNHVIQESFNVGETSSLASLTAPASFVNQTNGAGSSSSGSGSNSHLHNNADHIPEDHQHIQLDEEIDPALRAIVNSLTNAQQSQSGNPHSTDTEERDRLEQSLQTTLDDLAQGNYSSYGSLFPPAFHQSPSGSNLLLHEGDDENSLHPHEHQLVGESDSNLPLSGSPSTNNHSNNNNNTSKRGRGRPKGAKNKPKPPPAQPVRLPTPPPRKPKGRPMKIRSAEEQAEIDRRKAEKEAGIQRRKGRPRKFPGYLVREMRLKRNRQEMAEVMRAFQQQQQQEQQQQHDHEHDFGHDHDQGHGQGQGPDQNQNQNQNVKRGETDGEHNGGDEHNHQYEGRGDGGREDHGQDKMNVINDDEIYRAWDAVGGGASFLDVVGVGETLDSSDIGQSSSLHHHHHQRHHHHHHHTHHGSHDHEMDLGMEMEMEMSGMDGGDHIDEPSSQALGLGNDESMRGVFGLEVGLE